MRVILCLDDNNGMAFNSRRQSRDRVIIADILCDLTDGESLFVSPYSKSLFDPMEACLVICDDPMMQAPDEGICFVEKSKVSPYLSKIDAFVIYRWNRRYPADLYFDFDLKGFELEKKVEFSGSSHENVTKEIWRAV